MMVLQRGMNFLQGETGLYNETRVAASYDGNQVINIKVEEVPYIKEEEDPELISSPEIKTGHEVSFMAFSPVYLVAVSAVVKKQVGTFTKTTHTVSVICFKLQ
jgi:hypothetical protein